MFAACFAARLLAF